MRLVFCLGLVLLLGGPGRADPAPGKLVAETWEAAYFEGARAGYAHTIVREVGKGDAKLLRTTRNLYLKVKRYDSVVSIRLEGTTDEKPDGKAVAFSFTQFLDGGKKLTLTGQVEDGKLVLRSSADPASRALPWKEGPIGLHRQDTIFAQKKVKPGDSFSFLSY